MPHSHRGDGEGRGRRLAVDESDEEALAERQEEEKDDLPPAARKRHGKRERAEFLADDEEEGEEEETKENVIPSITAGGAAAACIFTSQGPDATQDISNVKDFELRNLLSLPQDRQDKAVCDLFRVVLFRAHQMEPIDRAKCLKEAGIAQYRVSSAVFQEVETRLQNLFGYSLRRVPKFMEKMKGLPANIKDRYYVINTIEDPSGQHSTALHAVHGACMIEKALLMVVLGLVYCKGSPRHDGSRWILDKDLYRYLHALDENIPEDPPSTGWGKKRPGGCGAGRGGGGFASLPSSSQRISGTSVVSQTPDVDALLDKFVSREHLVRQKATDDHVANDANVDSESCYYAMGPRSALEVGRTQVVYFCAEILGTEPDPAMLKEIEEDDEDVGGVGGDEEATTG